MHDTTVHRSTSQLRASLDHVRSAPRGTGTIEMIVTRPDVGARATPDRARFTGTRGLIGDSWERRAARSTADGGPDPERQVTMMNSRYLDLIAGSRDRWPLAGDQLIVDLDLSEDHLGPGDRLRAGSAIFGVTAPPHLGCKKFTERFGKDAMALAGSRLGRHLHLRGIHVRVVQDGWVRVGDAITKLGTPDRATTTAGSRHEQSDPKAG